eukprot:1141992-Pelagomonas_calceolata.AAC.4
MGHSTYSEPGWAKDLASRGCSMLLVCSRKGESCIAGPAYMDSLAGALMEHFMRFMHLLVTPCS